ncbi:hypothetical protein LguiB_021238 [Lonicera macranthoides]
MADSCCWCIIEGEIGVTRGTTISGLGRSGRKLPKERGGVRACASIPIEAKLQVANKRIHQLEGQFADIQEMMRQLKDTREATSGSNTSQSANIDDGHEIDDGNQDDVAKKLNRIDRICLNWTRLIPIGQYWTALCINCLNCLGTSWLPAIEDDLNEPVVLWCANRDNPVRENATLHFTADSGLELKDVDGTLIWSTHTSALPVTRLNISDGANLMLLDSNDNVIWQSFDYPTDTWLPNQNISSHTGLTSSDSSSNLGTGLFSLTVEEEVPSNSLVAFFNSDPPQKYKSLPVGYLYNYFGDYSSIEGFSNNALFKVNRTAHRFLYIRLEPNGHLNLYQLPYYNETQRIAPLNIFEQFSESDCDYPTVCGNYGVCWEEGLCSCPGAGGNYSYFTQLQVLKPYLGCRPVTPLSCKDAHLHTFLELNGVTYFNLVFHYSTMDRDSCKKACLDNCTCKAAFFSSGSCSLQSQLYSLKSGAYNDSVTFIKVQKQKHKRKLSLFAVLVSTLSVGLVIILVVSCYYYKMLINWNNKEEEDKEGDDQVIGALKRFPFLELKSATRDFQVRLGRGGFGSVYEGDLADGTKVAVKCLDSIGQGRKEFLAEVNTIGSSNHFNLVRLIGYCAEKSNRLLVYEHMCNGSLDKWIFNPERTQVLGWELRRKIIMGLAKALEYLHILCNPSIIHFDIKPQNILLDGDFNVKISDFGLAKLIDRDQSQVLTVLKGTPGYVAPELFSGTNISVKADVFSFGIVILEIVFGRKNLDSTQSCPLINVVKEKAQNDQLHDLVDGHLENIQLQQEEAVKMIKIGIWCLQAHNTRPSISTVLKVLEGSMDLGPASEFCFTTTLPTESHLRANSAQLSTPPAASILSVLLVGIAASGISSNIKPCKGPTAKSIKAQPPAASLIKLIKQPIYQLEKLSPSVPHSGNSTVPHFHSGPPIVPQSKPKVSPLSLITLTSLPFSSPSDEISLGDFASPLSSYFVMQSSMTLNPRRGFEKSETLLGICAQFKR